MKNRVFSFALLFLAFGITAAVVLTGAFLSERYDIRVGSIAERQFKAPAEVVDEIATARQRESAVATVVNVFQSDPDAEAKIIAKLDNFFDEAALLRAEQTPIYDPYNEGAPIPGTGENTTARSAADAFSDFSIRLTEEQYTFLLQADSETYNEFRETVYSIASYIIGTGIREESLPKNLVSTEDEFDNLSWDNQRKNTGYDIVASVLAPTQFIDEEATQKAKDEKAAAVEPVVYLAGQNIVNAGDLITPEIFAVLDALGYTERSLQDSYIPIAGAMITLLILFAIVSMYIYYFNREMAGNRKEALLLFTLYSVCMIVARLMINLPFQFIPIILFTMLISLLLESRLAIIMSIVMTLVCSITVSGDASFIVYFMLSGVFAAIFAKYTTDRSKVFPVAILISFISGLTSLSFSFLINKNISNDSLNSAIYAVLNSLLTVALCIGTLPFWEAVFGIVTPIKMLDLTNPNNKLLRRLTIEAPGTYQHSLIVGNLAETAAYDIGADPTLARVGGYYHDIGKLDYPQYFSENQISENPHDALDPYVSAQIITGHIAKGIAMADAAKLPQRVVDMVAQHHGTTLIKYFYYKATTQYPDRDVDESDFRYNFNIPQSREAAIVMLADTVEAAVRSMAKRKTTEEVELFVRALIKDKLDDGQLLDSMLTIKDLDTIAAAFMRVFKGMYHERIPYPKTTMAELHIKGARESSEPETVAEGMATMMDVHVGDRGAV